MINGVACPVCGSTVHPSIAAKPENAPTKTELDELQDKAIKAKAKIHSPSKVATEDGEDYGQGWVNGILSKVKESLSAAEKLVSMPTVATPDLAMAYSGELSTDYDYYRQSEYTIEVPLSVDGKEFAKATVSYTQDELDKRQSRNDRKHGKI